MKANSTILNRLQPLFLLPALLLFAGLTCYQLNLPGFYADEALDVVPAMQLLKGLPPDFGGVRGAYLPLGSLKLPVMNSDYQGVVGTYGVMPFLLAGINVVDIRLFTVVTGLLAIILAYLLTKELFGWQVALLTAFLFAVAPSWVFWSRIGIYVVAQIVPLTLAILYCLLRWWRGGRDGWLLGGLFLIGLGFSTKFLFLWLPVALLLSYGLFSVPRIRQLGWLKGLRGVGTAGPRSRFIRNIIVAGILFLVGAFPIVYYNLLTRGTYLVLRSNLDTTTNGVKNSDLLGNLYTVVSDYRVVMDGSYFWFQAYAGLPHANNLYPLAYLVALAGLLLGCIVTLTSNPSFTREYPEGHPLQGAGSTKALSRRGGELGEGNSAQSSALSPQSLPGRVRLGQLALWLVALVSLLLWLKLGREARWLAAVFLLSFAGLLGWLAVSPRRTWYQRPLVFITTLVAFMVAQSAVTVSGLWPTHLVITMPVPQITIGLGVVVLAGAVTRLVRGQTGRLVGTGVAVALSLSLLVSDLQVDRDYHADLTRQGGYVTFSDAIYSLNDYLLAQQAASPIAMDWGFRYNLQVLSGGRTNPLEIFQYRDPAPPAFFNALHETLKNPANLYLFHVPLAASSHPDRMAAFLKTAQDAGLTTKMVRRFYHRDGAEVYEVWQALPKASNE